MIVIAQFDFVTLMPFALFGAFAIASWVLLEWLSGRKSQAEQRLDVMSDPKGRTRQSAAAKKSEAMTKMLEKATPALAKPLQPKDEKDANKLKQRLMQAGFRGESAPTIFLGMKLVGMSIGALFGGGMLILAGVNQGSIMKAIFCAGAMFYVPDAFVYLIGRNRKQNIFLGLPDALDLMVVCVEAGLGLDQAMRKVSEEMVKSYRVIAEEFGLCNMQLQMGRGRARVLQELGHRSGVDDLRSLASILIQADKFGSSIAQALRVQSDAMRTRRRQIAEEKAAKTAVKLIFPLVMFIFPGIFVVLVGPAAITMVREMFPAMGG
jgi:tight adherence protein C